MENTNNEPTSQEDAPPTAEESRDAARRVETALMSIRSATTALEKAQSNFRFDLKTALSSVALGDAADLISDCKIDIEAFENELKKAKESLGYCLEVTIPERFTAENIKTFNTDRFRVTKTSRVFASIISEQIEGAYKWLRDNDYAAIIKETVNSSTLSATAKELMESGRELPEEMFRTHTKDGTSITKKR